MGSGSGRCCVAQHTPQGSYALGAALQSIGQSKYANLTGNGSFKRRLNSLRCQGNLGSDASDKPLLLCGDSCRTNIFSSLVTRLQLTHCRHQRPAPGS